MLHGKLYYVSFNEMYLKFYKFVIVPSFVYAVFFILILLMSLAICWQFPLFEFR